MMQSSSSGFRQGWSDEKPAMLFLIFAAGITLGVVTCILCGGSYIVPPTAAPIQTAELEPAATVEISRNTLPQQFR